MALSEASLREAKGDPRGGPASRPPCAVAPPRLPCHPAAAVGPTLSALGPPPASLQLVPQLPGPAGRCGLLRRAGASDQAQPRASAQAHAQQAPGEPALPKVAILADAAHNHPCAHPAHNHPCAPVWGVWTVSGLCAAPGGISRCCGSRGWGGRMAAPVGGPQRWRDHWLPAKFRSTCGRLQICYACAHHCPCPCPCLHAMWQHGGCRRAFLLAAGETRGGWRAMRLQLQGPPAAGTTRSPRLKGSTHRTLTASTLQMQRK